MSIYAKPTYPPYIPHSKNLIKDFCKTALLAHYGKSVPIKITSRLTFELDTILKNGHEAPYLITKRIVDEINKLGYPTYARGSVGSSLVAYLLGITKVNPLQPHYLCPVCKLAEFVPHTKSGFDLPDIVCPDCGNVMKGDGHNIAFEFYAGAAGDRYPYMKLDSVAGFSKKAAGILQNMFPDGRICLANDSKTYGRYLMIIPQEALARFHKGKSHEQINALRKDFEYLSFHERYDFYKQIKFDEEMLALSEPKCFSDFVKLEALKYGEPGVWENNAKDLIKTGRAKLKDVFATGDDVYDCLIDRGMNHCSALLVTEEIRKGKGYQLDF